MHVIAAWLFLGPAIVREYTTANARPLLAAARSHELGNWSRIATHNQTQVVLLRSGV